MAKTKKHHSVYVIELDEAVLREKKFVLANPERDPYLSCLYVGMTGLDPEVRFENHKRGYKANWYARKYGLHLLPQIYEYYNPMSYKEAVAKEADALADALSGVAPAMKRWIKLGPLVRSWKKNLVPSPRCACSVVVPSACATAM